MHKDFERYKGGINWLEEDSDDNRFDANLSPSVNAMQDQEEGRGLDLNRLNSLRKMSLKSSAVMHEAGDHTTFSKQLPLTHTLEPLGQGCTLQSEIDFQNCASSSIYCMISFIF